MLVKRGLFQLLHVEILHGDELVCFHLRIGIVFAPGDLQHYLECLLCKRVLLLTLIDETEFLVHYDCLFVVFCLFNEVAQVLEDLLGLWIETQDLEKFNEHEAVPDVDDVLIEELYHFQV